MDLRARSPAKLAARRARLRRLLFLAVAFLASALALGLYGFQGLRSLELNSVDTRFALRGAQPQPFDVVVVQIDDDTFNDLRVRWPFPRSLHAKVIDRIAADGARAIAYDIQFTEPTTPVDDSEEAIARAAEEDNALIAAVQRAGNVVLATTEVDEHGGSNVFGGDEVLREIGAVSGNGLLPTDRGGVIRRIAYEVDGLKTFGLVAAERAGGRQIERSDFQDGRAWIDFVGPPGSIRTVSFSQVHGGRLPSGFFDGKIVVVGPSAPSLQDIHPTSTSGDTWMSGAEIQANVVSTALRGFPLRSVPPWVDAALIVLLALIPPLASMRYSALHALGASAALGVAFAASAHGAFEAGWMVAVVYPLGGLAVASVGSLAVYYVLEAFERERVRDVFSRFVDEKVVDTVLERADGLRLGGVRQVGTVMFTDLRGFTSFSESLPPDRVIEMLNHYLSEMSDAILQHGGALVSYMGDGIFAVFGAPIEQPDHADRALASAREMLDVRLPRFNEAIADQGFDHQFRMGIGLNTGAFMSGNVGSERRLEYAAIGDTTNTASRIEGMTKGTPHMLFFSESTLKALTREPPDAVYFGEMEVRGRQKPIRLWSLRPAHEVETQPAPAAAPEPEPAPEAAPAAVT
jgi:adenylate cyclase